MIEAINREYGDHTERMIMAVENGRCYRWNKPISSYKTAPCDTGTPWVSISKFFHSRQFVITVFEIISDSKSSAEVLNDNFSKHLYDFNSSGWLQFNILVYRMFLQMWHDRVRYFTRICIFSEGSIKFVSTFFRLSFYLNVLCICSLAFLSVVCIFNSEMTPRKLFSILVSFL